MKQSLLTAACLTLLGATAAAAQVCISTPESGPVCLSVQDPNTRTFSEVPPDCSAPAVTQVEQTGPNSSIIQGSLVCQLRVVPDTLIELPDGRKVVLIQVNAKLVGESGRGVSGPAAIAPILTQYYSHQLVGVSK